MGKRGPLPGQGGRPPESARRVGKSQIPSDLARYDLHTISQHDLDMLLGSWRPHERQDRMGLDAVWDLIMIYRRLWRQIQDSDPIDIAVARVYRGINGDLRRALAQYGVTPAARARLDSDGILTVPAAASETDDEDAVETLADRRARLTGKSHEQSGA